MNATTRNATMQRSRWELRVRDGRAVLIGRADGATRGAREHAPEQLPLPPDLVAAVHEWAHVVHTTAPEQEIAGETSAALLSRRGRVLAARLATETGAEICYWDPARGRVTRFGRVARPGASDEPTPWGTGLALTGFTAAIVVIALVVVSLGLAEVSTPLAAFVNLVVAGGFAPSVWLGRRLPVWRWVAFGTALGVVLAWVALALSALGP